MYCTLRHLSSLSEGMYLRFTKSSAMDDGWLTSDRDLRLLLFTNLVSVV